MSHENLEVVRQAFDAFDRGDIEAVLRLCGEDIVITQPPELLGVSRQQHGHAGVREAFGIWPEQWDDFQIEILDARDGPNDSVLVSTRQRGRGKQSGVEVEIEMPFLFTVRNDKIVEWRMFMSEDQALEAAGRGSKR